MSAGRASAGPTIDDVEELRVERRLSLVRCEAGKELGATDLDEPGFRFLDGGELDGGAELLVLLRGRKIVGGVGGGVDEGDAEGGGRRGGGGSFALPWSEGRRRLGG